MSKFHGISKQEVLVASENPAAEKKESCCRKKEILLQEKRNPAAASREQLVLDYIKSHIDAEGDYLHALWRDTNLKLPYGQMASGHIQGRLLKMLVTMIRPKRVLELGTFSGYSALSMAEGMDDDAELHTFEIFDEQEDFLRPWFERSAYADRIHLHIGDALELVPKMDMDWDLVFIDADKRQYVDYYEMVLPRLRPGGYIIADNTLWYGRVVEDNTRDSDLQTLGIKAFNDRVAADDRVEKVIVPVRDGLTLIRKRPLSGLAATSPEWEEK